MHLTPSRFSPPPSTYNAVTLPPPLQVSRIYLPRGWFKDSAKLAGGSDNLWGISSGWEFNEPLDGRLIFLYSLDFVLLYCSCVDFLCKKLIKECRIVSICNYSYSFIIPRQFINNLDQDQIFEIYPSLIFFFNIDIIRYIYTFFLFCIL